MEDIQTIVHTKSADLSPIATVKSIRVNKRLFELFILICLAMFSFQDVNVKEVMHAEKKTKERRAKALVESKRRFIAEKEKAFALFNLMSNSIEKETALSKKDLHKKIETSFVENILENLPKTQYANDLPTLFEDGIIHLALYEQEKSNIPASIQLALIIVKTNMGKLVYQNDLFGEGGRAFASYKDAFRANSLVIQNTELVAMLNANGNDINEWIFTVSETKRECALLKKVIDEFSLELLDS